MGAPGEIQSASSVNAESGCHGSMGYKRRVRVLFVDGGSGAAARALDLSRELGEGRLEARAAAVADEDMLGWADLVVTMVDRVGDALPGIRGKVSRTWALPVSAGARDEALRERVLGLVGGIRLLEAPDGE